MLKPLGRGKGRVLSKLCSTSSVCYSKYNYHFSSLFMIETERRDIGGETKETEGKRKRERDSGGGRDREERWRKIDSGEIHWKINGGKLTEVNRIWE
jgi:hypothetical protein